MVVCRLAVFVLKLFSLYSQFEGELYLLATDQGYINQPDLVWEKLNEVKQYCFMIFFIEIIYFLSFYVATGRCSQLNIFLWKGYMLVLIICNNT